MTTANTITNPRFFTAGRATFTVSNPHGDYYTYRIQKPRVPIPGRAIPLFAKVKQGTQYKYLGIYDPASFTVRITPGSTVPLGSKPVKVLEWATRTVARGGLIPDGYAIQHDGRCCSCGRQLTTPDSIKAGIGPECLRKRTPGDW